VTPKAARPSGAENDPRLEVDGQLSQELEAWALALARILLGLVLAWFGYHELDAPLAWTGYVPALSPASHLAEVLVLAHGWLLLVLATALVAGVVPRAAAVLASLVVAEIVISLAVSSGLSDLVLRDVGVLGLGVAVAAVRHRKLVLTR
jgi:uncharacterized membrane protein YphA (DoxX/SURF4 family)